MAHLGQAGEQTLGRIAFPLQCVKDVALQLFHLSGAGLQAEVMTRVRLVDIVGRKR